MARAANLKVLFGILFFALALFLADRALKVSPAVRVLSEKKKERVIIKAFSFQDKDSMKAWKEKILDGRVKYNLESSNGQVYIHAVSDNACSAMYYQTKLYVDKDLFLSWRWRVAVFPDKKSPDQLLSKAEDDYAARVYVLFPALFFKNSKALEYVWTKDAKDGVIASSPYSENIKIIIAESGSRDGWVSEQRNIYKDYTAAFNAKPMSAIGAIAFMCDSDSTGSKAEAFFDDITIYRSP